MKKLWLRRWVLVCALLSAQQFGALAHAFLDHAEPPVGSEVNAAPAVIKIWFTQSIEPAFSKIRVEDASGNEVDKKDVRVDTGNKSLLVVSLPPLSTGTYTVVWTVVSVDTHKTQGHFQFTVKASN